MGKTMGFSVQVQFRNLPISDEMESACWREAAVLNGLGVSACAVAFERTAGQSKSGNRTNVRLDVNFQNRRVVAADWFDDDERLEACTAALRRCFSAIQDRAASGVKGTS